MNYNVQTNLIFYGHIELPSPAVNVQLNSLLTRFSPLYQFTDIKHSVYSDKSLIMNFLRCSQYTIILMKLLNY
jgi:hypothetical protein